MKVAIITLIDYKNYGNRLQNFAMNCLIQSLGFDTRNICLWNRSDSGSLLKEAIKSVLPLRITYLIQRFRAYDIKNLTRLKRVIRFWRFSQKYTPVKLVVSKSDFRNIKLLNMYDYFAVGSDQVWNPYYVCDEKFFLTFSPPSKRLALIASFGTESIPQELQKSYTEWLYGLSYISVRESSAVGLVQNLTGLKADLFPDPTLLLEKEKWNQIIKKPRINIPGEYALSFFFGKVPQDVLDICEEKGVSLLRANDERKKGLYTVDPAEMLFLIQKARIIFTDSFHIMALSIKFNKQFYVFNRKEFAYMYTRISSLLEMLNISHCAYLDADQIHNWVPVLEEQYININYLLEEERTRFLNKLQDVMGSVGKMCNSSKN